MFWKKRDQDVAKNSAGKASDRGDDAAAIDPHRWLEEIDGEDAIAWVESHNKRSIETLEAHPSFEKLHADALNILQSEERIAAPALVGDEVRNFWQDENNARGLWRQASLESYLNGAPEWETVLDIDQLAADEDENWVFAGAVGLAPDRTRTMVTLSRGGADAAVRREFDVAEKAFVDDGFNLPEAKGGVAWGDRDTLFVAPKTRPPRRAIPAPFGG